MHTKTFTLIQTQRHTQVQEHTYTYIYYLNISGTFGFVNLNFNACGIYDHTLTYQHQKSDPAQCNLQTVRSYPLLNS